VKTENKEGLRSDIVIYDSKGVLILKTVTDDKGRYGFHTPLSRNEKYTLIASNDSSFDKAIPLEVAAAKNFKFMGLLILMPKLKSGKKYVLESLNFYGGSDSLLPESFGSVNGLAMLMKKNKKMVIRVEGHVNHPGSGYHAECAKPLSEDQLLSERRAKRVVDMLADRGVEKERMSALGLNCSKMLFPNATQESIAKKNRRVEINVISLQE